MKNFLCFVPEKNIGERQRWEEDEEVGIFIRI